MMLEVCISKPNINKGSKMKNVEIVKKQALTKYELNSLFNILKLNMLALNVDVKSEDKEVWSNNLKQNLQNPNHNFYIIFYNQEIVGFFSTINKEKRLYIPEVQLADKVKGTKLILEVVKFIYLSNYLKDIQEINFSILKNNNMSYKTFSHLGGKIIAENERKFNYSLLPEDVKNYLIKLNQISPSSKD